MSQLLKVRLPNGQTVTPADWTTAEPIWSTVEIKAGPLVTQEAFTYGIGGSVPGSATQRTSTLLDTNLQGEGGRLPENEAMVVQAISVEAYLIPPPNAIYATDDNNVVAPDVGLSNMLRMQRDLLVTISIASVKEYIRAPLAFMAAGSGIESGTASGVGGDFANGYIAASNGATSVKGLRHLASPLFIQGGEAFRLRYLTPRGEVAGLSLPQSNSRIRLRAFLHGYHKRPVA